MRLGDVCSIRYGKDHKKLSDGKIPVYGSGGIMRHVDKALWDKPSVLIPRKGTLGNLFFVDKPFWTVDTLFWTDIDQSRVMPRFLYYALKTKNLAELNVGTAVPSLTTDVLNEVEVDIPDLDLQESIVSLLQAFDSTINVNSLTNDYLHDLVMAVSRSIYWEIEAADEALPDGWRWVEVDEIAELVSRGITPKYDEDSDETVLGQTCVRNNLVLVENGRLHKPKKVNEKWLRKGDLLINSTGVGSLGRTAQVWFEPEKLTVDSHITIVRARKPEHALYLGFWAFAHERYIESLHTGSTGQTELPRDHVKAIRFVLPGAATLSWFNSIAEPVVKAIVANQDENKKLEVLHDALLPKLMSGEIDVSKVELPA